MGTGNSSLGSWNPSALTHAFIHLRHWYAKDQQGQLHLFTLFHDIAAVRLVTNGERKYSDPQASLSLLDHSFQLQQETASGCKVVITGRKVGEMSG